MNIPSWKEIAGIDTILAEKHDTPLVSFIISIPAGSYQDPDGKSGLANFVSNLLLRGTEKRSRSEIEDALDQLGATLTFDVAYHTLQIQGQVLNRNLDSLIELLSEILTIPAFSNEEIQKLKDETIAQLHTRLEDDGGLARLNFLRAIYSDHPYGKDTVGSPKTITTFTREDVVSYYRRTMTRHGMLVGGAGAFDATKFEKFVKTVREMIPNRETQDNAVPFTAKIKGRNVILVDKPDRTQTQFYIGGKGIDVSHEDYYPMLVFNTAFGGRMFQAKYMQEIRVKRGWSYGAYSSIDTRRDGGVFFVHTFPAIKDTIPAMKLSIELLDEAISTGMKNEELEFAKTYLARSFPFIVDTPTKMISQLILNRTLRRPDDHLQSYVENIRKVTPDQVRKAVKRNLTTEDLMIVVLCTAKDLQTEIKAALKADKVEVIPFDDL